MRTSSEWAKETIDKKTAERGEPLTEEEIAAIWEEAGWCHECGRILGTEEDCYNCREYIKEFHEDNF